MGRMSQESGWCISLIDVMFALRHDDVILSKYSFTCEIEAQSFSEGSDPIRIKFSFLEQSINSTEMFSFVVSDYITVTSDTNLSYLLHVCCIHSANSILSLFNFLL